MIALASLLMVLSCGSGDEMAVPGSSPLDIITGSTGSGLGGGPGGGPGGGGATGACVVDNMVCYQGMDRSTCDWYASVGATTNFVAGGSCNSLGYPICTPPIAGVEQCTAP